MRHIFLSYSRKDIDAMSRVRDTLRAEGFTVWTDENLTPGTPQWDRAIQNAIANASAVVVLLSPSSNASEWVANEVAYARTHNVRIFPILIRGEERESVPINLIRVQRIDIRTRFLAHMQTLVDEIQEHWQSFKDDGVEEPPPASLTTEPDVYTARELARYQFWKGLLESSKKRTNLFGNTKPQYRHWIGTSAGKTGFGLNYSVGREWTASDFYIDLGDQQKNKAIFDAFYEQHEQIHAEFGEELTWQRLNDRQASRIIKQFYSGGIDTPEKWPELQEQMIDAMIRIDKVFRPRLRALK